MDYKIWLDKAIKIHKIAANMSNVNDDVVLCGYDSNVIMIHVFKGIELLAEAVGKKLTVCDHTDKYIKLSFDYNGCRIFQLKERTV